MNKIVLWVMLSLFLSTSLIGCGQKGDLYPSTDDDKMRRDRRSQG